MEIVQKVKFPFNKHCFFHVWVSINLASKQLICVSGSLDNIFLLLIFVFRFHFTHQTTIYDLARAGTLLACVVAMKYSTISQLSFITRIDTKYIKERRVPDCVPGSLFLFSIHLLIFVFENHNNKYIREWRVPACVQESWGIVLHQLQGIHGQVVLGSCLPPGSWIDDEGWADQQIGVTII